MNTSANTHLPEHCSFQPLLSLSAHQYREYTVSRPCTLCFYEFYATENIISYIPNGCMDFLMEENSGTSVFLHPYAALEQIPSTIGSRYFGVRFPSGMLPNRHFQSEFYTCGIVKLASFEERITWFCTNFQPERQTSVPSEPVRNIIDEICASRGTISVHELSTALAYSERHVHRLFLSHMGYSPKHYSRVIRFRSALEEMLLTPGKSISDYIRNLGYSDQAHFQREFKTFTGMTPKQFHNLFILFRTETSQADSP